MKMLETLSEKAKQGFLQVASGVGDSNDLQPKSYRRVSGVIIYRYGVNGLEFLIVKKPRRYNAWQFAQGGADAGETLLHAAKRETKEELGGIDLAFYPKKVARYTYDFPKDFKRHDKNVVGASVTFFLAEFLDGDILLDPKELQAFAWVGLSDLQSYFSPEYWQVVYPVCASL